MFSRSTLSARVVALFAVGAAALAGATGCTAAPAVAPPVSEPTDAAAEEDAFSVAQDEAPITQDAGSDAVLPTPPAALGLNDVTVLMPLPATISAAGHLTPTSAGALGELFPRALYERIPQFPHMPADFLKYETLRVLAVRFDGCFKKAGACEAQIRLVLQPLRSVGASDAAVHLFFPVGKEAMQGIVAKLREMRALAPEALVDGALDVHPSLLAQGMEGAYGTALNQLVLEHCGLQALSRMTFFLRAPSAVEQWVLGGLDIKDGKYTPIAIPGSGTRQNVLQHETAKGPMFRYELVPLPVAPVDLTKALSTTLLDATSGESRIAALGALNTVLNPQKLGADDVHCASCHVASYIAGYAQSQLKEDLAAAPSSYLAAAPKGRNLEVRGGALSNRTSLRGLGYFQKTPMISPRVVYESAEVLEDFETNWK
jgi:hypothetical protein